MRIGVIGGGPAGLFTALGLRARGYDVLVTEAGDYDTPRAGEHLVAEALHELRKAGVPEVLLFENSLPCTQVKSAWGRGDLHSNESLFNPFGDGFILSRPGFDKALMQYGREQGVEVRTQCRVARVEREEQTWTLHLGNERLSVDFLVDATGRNSKFRLDPRAEKKREDHLVGISRAVTLSGITKVENTYLLVEAVENGWWYSVQLASGEWVGTFMTDAHLLSENKGPSEEFWEEQLGKSVHTQQRFSGMKAMGKAMIQSAHTKRLTPAAGDGWLAVGDAAQSFDPLSSAGIIKGFRMGIQAAEKINACNNGNADALMEYEEEVDRQYREYLSSKREYYARETRWNHQPFWFMRNLVPREIAHFTISPHDELNIVRDWDDKTQRFLSEELPEVDFELLISSIRRFPLVKDAVNHYISSRDHAGEMPHFMLYALESLRLVGFVRKKE